MYSLRLWSASAFSFAALATAISWRKLRMSLLSSCLAASKSASVFLSDCATCPLLKYAWRVSAASAFSFAAFDNASSNLKFRISLSSSCLAFSNSISIFLSSCATSPRLNKLFLLSSPASFSFWTLCKAISWRKFRISLSSSILAFSASISVCLFSWATSPFSIMLWRLWFASSLSLAALCRANSRRKLSTSISSSCLALFSISLIFLWVWASFPLKMNSLRLFSSSSRSCSALAILWIRR